MPRIATLDLTQVNLQVDRIDKMESQLLALTKKVNNVGFQATTADPTHGTQTTNNITFTWTGGANTISWPAGIIQDKNASAQKVITKAAVSSAPGALHNFPVTAGTLALTPSTYYWMGWDHTHNVMQAQTDVRTLYQNQDVLVVCQLFTGTAMQTGVAGGGGSQMGFDLSGARYKLF